MTDVVDRIPLVDLRAQYRLIARDIDGAIRRVVEQGAFVLGPEVCAFEEEWAAWCDVPHAIGVSNGTDALRLSLLALGVGPGAEVVTVANTFVATAEAIVSAGARPVFVDVDAATHTMDPARLAAAITPRTRAVLVVHLYGQPADLDPIREIAAAHDVPVVEDAAQAHGARYRGRRVGGIGRIGCFSFFPAKNLGAYGDAGAVVTGDADLAARVRRLRDHGRVSKYLHDEVGFNCRMDALQGAILRAKLPYLERWNAQRRALVETYRALLDQPPAVAWIGRGGDDSAHHLMVIAVDDRDAVRERLEARGIGTGIHYPVPLHLQPAFAWLGGRDGQLPVTEVASRRILSLPLYPEMTREHVHFVVRELRRTLGT